MPRAVLLLVLLYGTHREHTRIEREREREVPWLSLDYGRYIFGPVRYGMILSLLRLLYIPVYVKVVRQKQSSVII